MKAADSELTLDILNGFAGEETAWKVFADISSELAGIHSSGKAYGNIKASSILFDGAGCFHLAHKEMCSIPGETIASDIWALGAAVFKLLMGVPVFWGRGEEGQTVTSPIPTFRKDRYDEALGNLVGKCLSFLPEERPSAEIVSKEAAAGLDRCRSARHRGRIPRGESVISKQNILKYWPEKMI